SRQGWQSIVLILRPAVFDLHVLTLDVASLFQALPECAQKIWNNVGRPGVEEPDHRHRGLLPSRGNRPCRRAADKRDELAAFHSMTSLARSRNDSGILMPIALAVVRLTTSSNLVGCSTGISPGFVPRKILSTKSPARRNKSRKFGP